MNPDTNSNFGYSIISTNVQFQPKTPKLMKKLTKNWSKNEFRQKKKIYSENRILAKK